MIAYDVFSLAFQRARQMPCVCSPLIIFLHFILRMHSIAFRLDWTAILVQILANKFDESAPSLDLVQSLLAVVLGKVI